MEYRSYKQTDEKVSLLGFGAMRLPIVGGDSSNIDYEPAKALVDAAIKGGVNYFDTAYVYHGEKSEVFLGKALAEYPRDSLRLASKLPLGKVSQDSDVLKMFNEQLERCKTDYFDYYLCHGLNGESYKLIEKYNMWQTLTALKKEGKIRHLGFSFHDSPKALEEICSAYEWDFCQIQLNYLDWDGDQDAAGQYAVLERHGIPCLVMEPVRGGRLATLGDEADAVLKQANPQRSVASWAIRFAAQLPNVLTVLSGMSTMEQVLDNVATMTPFAPLSDEEKATLDKAAALFRGHAMIPCTACRYCMPCPSGVDIPALLALYNKHAFDGSMHGLKHDYSAFPAEANASHCVTCGQCEAACPQHIGIMALMEKLNAAGA